MVKALLSILNVVEGEEKPVLLLLGYGFFMGIFLAAYKIVATTLFLNQMSEYIREAFFVSGVLGVITTWLYASFQNRVQYSKLIIFNILTIFIFIAFARWMFHYYDSRWLVFALFVMLGPITSLLVLGFWGIFGRLFDLRQSKRIIGGIDSGQLTAIIITTFSIPFLIPYVANITDILIIGEIGLAISIVFFVFLILKFHLTSFHQKHKEIRAKTSFINIFKNKYIVYLSLFLLFSMSAFVFAEYSFMNVTEQQYPNEKQLASFLGVFEGSIMVLSLIIQTFVNERLLSMYGMKTSLLVLPVVLLLFTGLAIFAGHFFGFDVTNPNFLWFFLFVALSKLFVSTLREAMESPVFKLFFMPLDSRIRFDIQTKIEGTINEFSRAFSGGVILLLGFFPFFELIHYSWILVAIIAGWIYLVFKLYNLYRVNIRLKLERQKEEADRVEQKGKNLLLSKLFSSIDSSSPNLMIFALRALSKVAPDMFKKTIKGIKNNHSIDLTEKVLQTLEGDFSFIHIANLSKIKQRENQGAGKSVLSEEISGMIKSPDKAERKLAAELIGATGTSDGTGYLIELLHDSDAGVVKASMNAAAELKKEELLPFVIDNLKKKSFKDSAIDALVNYGEISIPSLESIFYNSEKDVDVNIDIVTIYGKIGGELAIEILWNKIDYPDKKVVAQVLLSLSHCGFVAQEKQVKTIKFVIEEDVSNIISNLKAIEQLTEYNKKIFSEITRSLQEENKHYYEHIYMLLSMIYDQKSIQLVKENIETNTTEGISYAIELLDVFLSEDLKQKIIPVLDDTSDIDRIRRLEVFYPFLTISIEELIRLLINREFNSINRWTKASVIHYIGFHKIAGKFDMELVANLFNPDLLLRETAAWSMYQIDKTFYKAHINRLEPEEEGHLQNLILGQKEKSDSPLRYRMKFEIVDFLKDESLIKELPSYILASVADFGEEVFFEDNDLIEANSWNNDCFYIVCSGILEVRDNTGEVIDQFVKGDFMGEQINIDLMSEGVSTGVIGETVLFKIEKNKFLDLITNEYEVTLKLLESFESPKEYS